MPRRVKDPSADRRDWITRADEALVVADKMPDGPLRNEAVKKAAQLRSAGEIMGALRSPASPAKAATRPRPVRS